jgi:uncharacterized protein
MFLDINDIGPAGLSIDRRLELQDLEGPSGEALPVHDAHIAGELTRGSRGVDLSGRFDATVRALCSRCLEPFEVPLASEFFLTLTPEPVEMATGENQMNEDDVSLFHAPEGRVDLVGVVTEQIYLGLPLKPICDEGCRGLCPRCGVNLNQSTCECPKEEIDPRLAPLLELTDNSRES